MLQSFFYFPSETDLDSFSFLKLLFNSWVFRLLLSFLLLFIILLRIFFVFIQCFVLPLIFHLISYFILNLFWLLSCHGFHAPGLGVLIACIGDLQLRVFNEFAFDIMESIGIVCLEFFKAVKCEWTGPEPEMNFFDDGPDFFGWVLWVQFF